MNILLLNPGRRDYMVNFFLSLRKKYNLTIFLIDPDKNIPAFQVSSLTKNYICPKLKDSKKFFYYLENFIKKKKKLILFFQSQTGSLKFWQAKNCFYLKKE